MTANTAALASSSSRPTSPTRTKMAWSTPRATEADWIVMVTLGSCVLLSHSKL
jgi:hypothetical protein